MAGRRTHLGNLCVAAGLLFTTPALPTSAAPRAGAGITPGHHDVVASKLVGMRCQSRLGTEELFGTGLVFEHTVVPHALEFEVSWASLAGPRGAVVPIDLLVKRPLHVGRHVDLFVGGGAAVNVRTGAQHHWAAGVIASAGSWFWAGEHFGVLLEVDYALVFEQAPTHELEAAVGVALRFD